MIQRTAAPTSTLVEHDVECVLSDGTVLRADVFRPMTDEPVPALLHRTPYDKARVPGAGVDLEQLVAAGYGVIVQDTRGRFRSEGEFTPSANEAADGSETVAWASALPWCDGNVGMWGASYTAEVQWSAKAAGAPALRAMVPALSPAHSSFDGFRYRGGVPEFGSMVGWALAASDDRIARLDGVERETAEQAHARLVAAAANGSLFRAGSWAHIPAGDPMVDWMLRQLAEPYDSPAHDLHKVHARYDRMDAPALLVGGWYDVFLGSTLAHYRALAARAARGEGPQPGLLIGPWSHVDQSGRLGVLGATAGGSADDIGGAGSLTDWHLAWYDAALRGKPLRLPRVNVFDTGTRDWEEMDAFPPPAQDEPWYLSPRGGLSRERPDADRVDFVVDPLDPVPTIGGSTLLDAAHPAGPFDQRPVAARDDVASFRSEPLDEPLPVAGAVRAVVAFSTSGDDADVVVRLGDERPDGVIVPVADGVVRLVARGVDPDTGAGDPTPVAAGSIVEVDVDLWAAVHTFAVGHRIHVDVAGSSSPRWAVNRHVLADPFDPVAPRPATHTVYVGIEPSSRIILPRRAENTQREETL